MSVETTKVQPARCPRCNRRGTPQGVCGDMFYCRRCDAVFDSEPDEGGDYSDYDPSYRLQRQERWARRKQGGRR